MDMDAADDTRAVSPSSLDKRKNKLGYQRISVACGHCRRRKIRCSMAENDPQGRCSNCIRLKKECIFSPVDTLAPEAKPQSKSSRPSKSSSVATDSPTSATAAPYEIPQHEPARYPGPPPTLITDHLSAEPLSAISASSAGSMNSSDVNFPAGYGPVPSQRSDWQSRSFSGASQPYPDQQWRLHESPVIDSFGHVSHGLQPDVAAPATYPYLHPPNTQSMGPPQRSASWAAAESERHSQAYGTQYAGPYTHQRTHGVLYSQNYPAPGHQYPAHQMSYAQPSPIAYTSAPGHHEQWAAYPQSAYLASQRHDSASGAWAQGSQMGGESQAVGKLRKGPGGRSRPD